MSEIVELYENIIKGVRRMIRNLFLLFLVFVLFIIIVVMAFHEGWVKIVIDPDGSKGNEGSNTFYYERNEDDIEYYFKTNPEFDLVRHIVEPGETLFDLENKYGTNWKVIQKVNKIADPIQLKIGTVVRVPVRLADI